MKTIGDINNLTSIHRQIKSKVLQETKKANDLEKQVEKLKDQIRACREKLHERKEVLDLDMYRFTKDRQTIRASI